MRQKKLNEKELYELKIIGLLAKLYRQSEGLSLAQRGAELGFSINKQYRFEKGLIRDYFDIKKELSKEGLEYASKVAAEEKRSERDLLYKLSELFSEKE